MKYAAVCLLGFMGTALGEPPKLPRQESLRYSVSWPSGLSLGEIYWSTSRSENGSEWNSEVTIEAGIPTFQVHDVFRSVATPELCSLRLEKEIKHGTKKSQEETTFNAPERRAVRQTKGGGKTELSIGGCPRDALGFINHVRQELTLGRIAQPQTVYFGAPYTVKLEYGGAQRIEVSGERKEADRIVGNLKGPASDLKFELYFARDPARTLLAAKVPVTIGTISLELIP